jgi:hypothetical protein
MAFKKYANNITKGIIESKFTLIQNFQKLRLKLKINIRLM